MDSTQEQISFLIVIEKKSETIKSKTIHYVTVITPLSFGNIITIVRKRFVDV